MDSDPNAIVHWTDSLTERQIKEVQFARDYVKNFNHGTNGHNALVLIALMADILDSYDESTDEE